MTILRTILVLCTGRSVATTLARACAHFVNFTVAQEGRSLLTGPARLDFPAGHIEIDNRRAWITGRLERHWGDRAGNHHLSRDAGLLARSFARRARLGILKACRNGILMAAPKAAPAPPLEEICRDHVDTVTENIRLFLKDKTHVMDMTLEAIETDFDRFADRIGAKGDRPAARREPAARHNVSPAAEAPA